MGNRFIVLAGSIVLGVCSQVALASLSGAATTLPSVGATPGVASGSQDPATLEMVFRDELVAENDPSGGLTQVNRDGTLGVGRSAASPPGRADSGVGTSKPALPELAWTPPLPCKGLFTDVPCGSQFDTWIEQLSRDGITSGCATGLFCPSSPVTRKQMAVFVERAMRGASGWPPHTVLVFHHPAAETSSNLSSGTELLAMVAAIPSTGAEAPSSTNPWLVRLGPGLFDLGTGSLTLPANTALEGAGQDITVITATGYADLEHGTVTMGDHGRLSRLTINNSGGDSYETAVYLPSLATRVAFDHVTLTASNPSNASGESYGLCAIHYTPFSMVDCEVTAHGANTNFGIYAFNDVGESRLDRVRVSVYGSNSPAGASQGFIGTGAPLVVTGSGFYVQDGSYTTGINMLSGTLNLLNSEVHTYAPSSVAVSISSGVSAIMVGDLISSPSVSIVATASGTYADISNCNIWGTEHWLYNASGSTVIVTESRLGGTTNNSGTIHCFGNSTGSAFLANTCP
jgi:hypothetical protein